MGNHEGVPVSAFVRLHYLHGLSVVVCGVFLHWFGLVDVAGICFDTCRNKCDLWIYHIQVARSGSPWWVRIWITGFAGLRGWPCLPPRRWIRGEACT